MDRICLTSGVIGALITVFASFVLAKSPQETDRTAKLSSAETTNSKDEAEFDKDLAFEFLEKVCAIGSRMSTSAGMQKQQEMLKAHFEEHGGAVYYQSFWVRHPNTANNVQLKNMLVRWHPDREKRLLICCHYDTRPFPDRDAINPRGVFIGANDGGSGVALMAELARHMSALKGNYGVDFVLFDGEEFVYVARRDPMFLGSTHFAHEYANGKVRAKYEAGVLVDMVADKNLHLFYEGNSLRKAPRVTREIWGIAGRLGIKEFVPKRRHQIKDDHLPLNDIARIPVCDIIDFDYPIEGNGYWHTQQDIVANCSADSLGKVGTVVLEWLRERQKKK